MSSRVSMPQQQDFIDRSMARMPPDVARTFTEEQIQAIRIVFDTRDHVSETWATDMWQDDEVLENEHLPLEETGSTATPFRDRRRPGRVESIPSTLMSLLRRPTAVIDEGPFDGDLRPIQGIASAMVLSLAFWGLVLVGVVLIS